MYIDTDLMGLRTLVQGKKTNTKYARYFPGETQNIA